MSCGGLRLAGLTACGAYGLRGLRLAGYAAEEGRRARLQFRCRAAAVPAAYRDHAWRHQFEAVEETQNVIPGVDVYLCGVGRGEALSLGRVAGTDGDDQVAVGSERPGKGDGHAAGGLSVREVQDTGQD